jgi:hypothetical protein
MLLPAMFVVGGVGAQEVDPVQLLEQVRVRYRSAPSYQASGKTVTNILDIEAGTETVVVVDFSMRLARPDFYRICWTQQLNLGRTDVGALWNDGEGPRLYQEAGGAVARLDSDRTAFSAAAGVSMGTAYVIPALFFGIGDGGRLLERLEDLRVDGVVEVGGIPCHIVAGRLPTGVDYRLWISTNDQQVVQLENTLGGSASRSAIPESTPAQLAKALEAMGMADTAENRETVRGLLDQARAVMSTVRGTARQVHERIDMRLPLGPEDFGYDVPAGVGESTGLAEQGAGGGGRGAVVGDR